LRAARKGELFDHGREHPRRQGRRGKLAPQVHGVVTTLGRHPGGAVGLAPRRIGLVP
jgi:hypothetical protein